MSNCVDHSHYHAGLYAIEDYSNDCLATTLRTFGDHTSSGSESGSYVPAIVIFFMPYYFFKLSIEFFVSDLSCETLTIG
jgi:hypothetical protein